MNQGAFDPTKMWIFGSGPGSSSSEPAGTTRYGAPAGSRGTPPPQTVQNATVKRAASGTL